MASLFISSVLFLCISCLPLAQSAALRGQSGVPERDALEGLMEVLSGLKQTPEVEARMAKMTEALRPIFKALPRSDEGHLEASAVRYLLHRYFINEHGWFVPVAGSRSEVANQWLPQVMLGSNALSTELSARLGSRGLSLEEGAVLASAVEMLASQETAERLHAAYRLVGKAQLEEHATESNLTSIHKAYLVMYVLGSDHRTMTSDELTTEILDLHSSVPNFDDLMKWAREVRSEVLATSPELRASFQGQFVFLDELQHRYGRWQDQECASVKEALQRISVPGTGRVPLQTFRRAVLPNGWETGDEDQDLLEAGALDVTNSSQPSLIIPNFFDSKSNCDDPSKYYSTCCISECDALLGHLERELSSPNALPQRIVELVEKLPSSTIEAPRTLQPQLVQRLEGVASQHGGHVQLHSRLFRQWIHHAFPNECSFPHVAGALKPVVPAADEAVKSDAQPLVEEVKEAAKEAVAAVNVGANDTAPAITENAENMVSSDELPWLDDDECYFQSPPAATELPKETLGSPIRSFGRGAIFLALSSCMLWRLWRMLALAVAAFGQHSGLPKYAQESKLV